MTDDPHRLARFVDAQRAAWPDALAELTAGRKASHWMWFVFPQIAGLGHSPTARFYAIASLDEARAYLADPLLGARLRDGVAAMMAWAGRRSAEAILGGIDALKWRSSLTLFERAADADAAANGEPFAVALDAFYEGRRDPETLARLGG